MEESRSGSEVSRALQILKNVPLIDGHNDFPYMIRGHFSNNLNHGDLYKLPLGQTDFNRLRQGCIGAQFWSAYVPCAKDTAPSSRADLSCLLKTLQQIDVIHQLIEKYPEDFGLVNDSNDIFKIFQSGRIASLIGVEGLHQICESFSVLRMYHKLGVRYITLTHNCNNAFADSATAAEISHGGLSAQGRQIVHEMNRIGMITDLSHTSNEVQLQVLEISRAPVIFSHSCCSALVPHSRNVSDTVLKMLKQNGGVIMICFLPSLLQKSATAQATVRDVIDHIMHVGQLIGFDHVGIGSDFDGMLHGPRDLEDVSRYPNLVVELLRTGLDESIIEKILAHNIIRVLGSVEKVSLDLRSANAQVICDEIEQVWSEDQIKILTQAGSCRYNIPEDDTLRVSK